jgi:geranylgeranyl diphosphate synthase type II
MRDVDALRELIERYLEQLPLSPTLGGLEPAVRYPVEAGGKRIRPVLCLATAEAAGGEVEEALPAAAAIELVHTFSLVHDDLPALDDDDERRGRPSAHVAFGEGVALLAGDALLAEAFRVALGYSAPAVARELAAATVAMIGGQYRDITGDDEDLDALHRLKTGALFAASVGCGLEAAGVPVAEQGPWREFAAELGPLFQIVDDVLDGDGWAARLGADAARALAGEAAERAAGRLDAVPADTSVLRAVVDALAVRTA